MSCSQSLSCSTGLKVIVAQVKTPKRGCRLLRLPVVDNPQIMAHMLSSPWLSVYSSGGSPAGTSLGWGGSDPLKVCWKGQSRILSPLKMIHSFIWNCCITASFTDSRMNSWILPLHWSCLCWRCYHPCVWSAPSSVLQSMPLLLLGLKLSMCYMLTMVQHKSMVAMKR